MDEIYLRLKTAGNNPVPTHSVFYFLPSVFVFVGSRFRIYGNGKGVFRPFPRDPVFIQN